MTFVTVLMDLMNQEQQLVLTGTELINDSHIFETPHVLLSLEIHDIFQLDIQQQYPRFHTIYLNISWYILIQLEDTMTAKEVRKIA